jgi:hypothetical protein
MFINLKSYDFEAVRFAAPEMLEYFNDIVFLSDYNAKRNFEPNPAYDEDFMNLLQYSPEQFPAAVRRIVNKIKADEREMFLKNMEKFDKEELTKQLKLQLN